MIDGFLDRGGSLLLLGPRFPPIDITANYHGGAQMGGHAGMFWWKDWQGGRWVDVDPRTRQALPAPEHAGTVYWGDGPLFAAWEHGLGLFGFETPCRGVFDVEGGSSTRTSASRSSTPTGPSASRGRSRRSPLPSATSSRRRARAASATPAPHSCRTRRRARASSSCRPPSARATDLLHRMLAHVATPGVASPAVAAVVGSEMLPDA